jgi:DNA mismatch repair protein MutS
MNVNTPIVRQYSRIKNEIPANTLLFMGIGAFYELLGDDARIAAPILRVTLAIEGEIARCRVPKNALDYFLAKLIRFGKRVAICEQTEDATKSTGPVRREINRVVTPGEMETNQP